MTEALNYAGLSPQWRDMNPQNIAEFQNEKTLRLFRMFSSSGQHLLLHDRNQQVGLIGVLLLLTGKSVITAGYKGWVNNRLRTFRGVLGIPEDHFIWVIKTTPPQRVLATLSTYLSANQPLRTRLFHVCFRAASNRVSVISQIFSTVVRLLRGVEMNHILLIDYFLFTKYPELWRIRPVRDNMARFNQAIAYLMTIPETERMFVKLLRPRSETAVLNRNNFIMLSAAAYAAAKYENPSMRNYREGQEAAAGGHVEKVVTTYLAMRTTHAITGMTRSPYAYLSQTELSIIDQETSLITRGVQPTVNTSEPLEGTRDFPPFRPPSATASPATPATPAR